MNLETIKDRLFGSGLKCTLKGVVEGAGLAALVPVLDMDMSKPEGKLTVALAVWRFVYGLFRK